MKQMAAVGALVGTFLAGYCVRGRVSGDKASASKEEAVPPRAVANGDDAKMIVGEKSVGASPGQVTAPASSERAGVDIERSPEADPPPATEDRAIGVASIPKKRGRAGNPTLAAAKASGVAADAPAADPPIAAAPAAEGAERGSCTLSINSIPISRVAVDGSPVGLTPVIGVSVSAGTHNVLLVTDTMRKTTVATCKAGEKKTISMRLTP